MDYQIFDQASSTKDPIHEDDKEHISDNALTYNTHNLSVDDILSKVGFGWYQVKAYIILGFILMNDGAESLVLSILQSVLETEWQLSKDQISWMGTAVFVSFLIGSLISGKISDRYGRQRPLVYVSFLLYTAGMCSALVHGYLQLVVFRAMYGFLVGIIIIIIIRWRNVLLTTY